VRSCVEALGRSGSAANPAPGQLALGSADCHFRHWRIYHAAVLVLALLWLPLALGSLADNGGGGNPDSESPSLAGQSTSEILPDGKVSILDIPEIEDVRPPIRALPRSNYPLLILAALLALAALVSGIYLRRIYCMRYSRRMALRELERLARAKMESDGDLLLFYNRLNMALRRYIHRCWKMERMRGSLSRWQRLLLICSVRDGLRLALTNRELLVSLSLDFDEQDPLRELLEECDLVKFARLRPGPDAARRALRRARDFILGWGMPEGKEECG